MDAEEKKKFESLLEALEKIYKGIKEINKQVDNLIIELYHLYKNLEIKDENIE